MKWALSFQLTGAGFPPDELRTEAVVTIEKDADGAGWTITAVDLTLDAKVPGIDQATFEEKAAAAKAGCPVSRVLNAEVTLNATLVKRCDVRDTRRVFLTTYLYICFVNGARQLWRL